MKRNFVLVIGFFLCAVISLSALDTSLTGVEEDWLPEEGKEYMAFNFAGYLTVDAHRSLMKGQSDLSSLYDEERASLDYRTQLFQMFIDGSFPRDTTTWDPWTNSETYNTSNPVGAFHAGGKAANLVACDGHAVTVKDLLEYEEEGFAPYMVESGVELGNLYYYYLPMYWYKVDATTKLRN